MVIEANVLEVTCRESQVIESLVQGATARDIAEELGVSYHTVRTHIRNIYSKLRVVNRIELLRWRDANLAVASRNRATPQESNG